MPSKEWNKYSPEEIRNCLLELSFNFLNYSGSAFSKKESKAVSDIVLYYAGMTDKWLEISGHSNNIFKRRFVKKLPIGNINIKSAGGGLRVFMEAILCIICFINLPRTFLECCVNFLNFLILLRQLFTIDGLGIQL